MLTAQQTKTIIQQLEGQLYLVETDITTRVIIYELLTTLLRLDDKIIDEEILESQDLLHCIVADIQKFDSNSNVLKVLFGLIYHITFQTVEPGLAQALYTDLELLQILT